jgi:hypothetical protein
LHPASIKVGTAINRQLKLRHLRLTCPYLVWSYHSALYAEILLSRLRGEIENRVGKRKLLRLIDDYHNRIAMDAPGYKRLASRL